ncbi:MAG: vitamin K epoxide reductase family protein [Chloroflexi bacterium]|nr:vitamin K epoxide reductase family protein [Chloroflexota bacterium]
MRLRPGLPGGGPEHLRPNRGRTDSRPGPGHVPGAGCPLRGAAGAWLTYVELYVLHAVCIWCVVSAATVALLLAVAVADLRSSLHRITPLPSSATRGATGEGA